MLYQNYVRCILAIGILVYAEAQDLFPLVTVKDTPGNIVGATTKVYSTAVHLRKKLSVSTFKAETFKKSMIPLYEKFAGILFMDNVIDESISRDVIKVTFDTIYNYKILKDSGVTDNQIESEIGNFDVFSEFLSTTSDLSLIFSAEDPDSFKFQGASLCGVSGVCDGNLVCTEVLNGVTITCISQCKLDYCKNNGTCEQTDPNQQPICTCMSSSNLWYIGERCQIVLALWVLVTVLICAYLVLQAAVVISCWIYRKKKRERKAKALNQFQTGVDNEGFYKNENNISPVSRTKTSSPNQTEHIYTVTSRRRRSSSRSRRRRRSSSRSRRRRRSSSYSRQGRETRRRSSTDDDEEYEERHSSATASVDGANDINLVEKGTSPIVWKIPEQNESAKKQNKDVDIAVRRGWKPSLGPEMFNLGKNSADLTTSLSEHSSRDETTI